MPVIPRGVQNRGHSESAGVCVVIFGGVLQYHLPPPLQPHHDFVSSLMFDVIETSYQKHIAGKGLLTVVVEP